MLHLGKSVSNRSGEKGIGPPVRNDGIVGRPVDSREIIPYLKYCFLLITYHPVFLKDRGSHGQR